MGTTNSVSLPTFVRSPTAWIELVDLRRESAPVTHRNRPIGRLVPPDMTLALLQGYQVSVGQLQANLAWMSHEVRKGQRFTVLQHGRRVLDIVPEAVGQPGRRALDLDAVRQAVAARPAAPVVALSEIGDVTKFMDAGDGMGVAGVPLRSGLQSAAQHLFEARTHQRPGYGLAWDDRARTWALVQLTPQIAAGLSLDMVDPQVARLCDLRIAQRALPEQAANIAGAYLRAVDGAWSLLVIINGGQGVVGVPVRSSGDDGLAGVPCDPEHVPHARAAIVRDLFGGRP